MTVCPPLFASVPRAQQRLGHSSLRGRRRYTAVSLSFSQRLVSVVIRSCDSLGSRTPRTSRHCTSWPRQCRISTVGDRRWPGHLRPEESPDVSRSVGESPVTVLLNRFGSSRPPAVSLTPRGPQWGLHVRGVPTNRWLRRRESVISGSGSRQLHTRVLGQFTRARTDSESETVIQSVSVRPIETPTDQSITFLRPQDNDDRLCCVRGSLFKQCPATPSASRRPVYKSPVRSRFWGVNPGSGLSKPFISGFRGIGASVLPSDLHAQIKLLAVYLGLNILGSRTRKMKESLYSQLRALRRVRGTD